MLVKGYLDEVKPYLSNVMNNPMTQDEGKIQLTMEIIFFSSKYFEQTHNMHTKSDNIETMIGGETDEIIE